MQTHPQPSAAVLNFLTAVRTELADLAPDERADLLAPVEQRLLELPNDAGTSRHLEELYGTPARLATDLRAAAGFPTRPAGPPAAQQPSSLAQWLRDQAARRPLAPVVGYLRSLRPAWWALRGFLLFPVGLAVLSQAAGYRLHTLGYYTLSFDTPRLGGEHPHLTWLWLLGPLAAIIASVVLGTVGPRLPRPLRLIPVLLNVLAVISLLAWPTWWMGPAFAFYSGLVS